MFILAFVCLILDFLLIVCIIYIFPTHSYYSTEIRKQFSLYLITLQTSSDGSKDNKYHCQAAFYFRAWYSQIPFSVPGKLKYNSLDNVCESFRLQSLIAFENMKKMFSFSIRNIKEKQYENGGTSFQDWFQAQTSLFCCDQKA